MNIQKALKFMSVATTVASFSKDRSTKVGAVAIDDNYNLLVVGYNGMVRGIDDSVESRHERPEKYQWFSHAEENLSAQAAYNGVKLKGSTVLVTSLFPCSTCARLLIQSGVKRIIATDPSNPRWDEESKVSKEMLKEAKVDVSYVRLNGEGIWEIDSSKQS